MLLRGPNIINKYTLFYIKFHSLVSGNYVGSIVCPNIEEYCMDDF